MTTRKLLIACSLLFIGTGLLAQVSTVSYEKANFVYKQNFDALPKGYAPIVLAEEPAPG